MCGACVCMCEGVCVKKRERNVREEIIILFFLSLF